MIDLVEPIIVSTIAFGMGCLLAYKLYKDRQGWDEFWENQNRRRPLAPKDWAGSATSKLLSYLFVAVLMLGGFVAMTSSIMNLLFSLLAGNK